MTAKEREALIRSELAARKCDPEKITSEILTEHEWWIQIEISSRTFYFGSVIRDGFSFSEIVDGEYISFMRHLSGTVNLNEQTAIIASAEMIAYCLIHPEFQGQDQSVI